MHVCFCLTLIAVLECMKRERGQQESDHQLGSNGALTLPIVSP